MLEVADIFRRWGAAYREKFAARLGARHRAAMAAIERCRTAALGGHLVVCDHCREPSYSYHSCKNRHCPKCHAARTRRWVDKARAKLLLPCPYFLLTFTLPAEIRPLARSEPRTIYRLLLQSSAAALRTLARDPRLLGAEIGALAVLHTWTRAMLFHPHAHLLVPAGGLSEDAKRWISPQSPSFLLPVRALSLVFRAKFRDRLKRCGLFSRVSPAAWSKPWVVHCQPAGSGEKVLDYLARYLFRVAIANSRLEAITDSAVVRFHYRDHRSRERRTATISAEEFISRFLDHVLPRRLAKVRFYGLFSAAHSERLGRARELLAAEQASVSALGRSEPARCLSDLPDSVTPGLSRAERCPHCGVVGQLRIVEVIPRGSRAPARPP